jgi:cyclopropane fatty-acyl-phospholipid synthase-like methyltransferase
MASAANIILGHAKNRGEAVSARDNVSPGMRVLDLGCGDGDVSRRSVSDQRDWWLGFGL